MAAVDTDICNLALGHLRQAAISSMNERTPQARECARFYQDAIDAALRAFDWPFARSYEAGAMLDVVPKPPWRYTFALPSACLAFRQIYHPADWPAPRYEITRDMRVGQTGRVLHCDEAAPMLVYTARVDDVAQYDPAFVLAASYQLASLLAMPLTGTLNLTDAFRKMALSTSAEAMTQAANEEPVDFNDEHTPDWLAVRGVR